MRSRRTWGCGARRTRRSPQETAPTEGRRRSWHSWSNASSTIGTSPRADARLLPSIMRRAESLLHSDRDRTLRSRRIILGVLWLAAFALSVSSYVFLDDHFDRISRARQIARYGELPFRDFLDPGYFVTEFSSAGLQLLLGDSLLADVLLSSVFVASGTTLVASLCSRVSHSMLVSLAAATLAW